MRAHTYPVLVAVASITLPPLPDIYRLVLICFPSVSKVAQLSDLQIKQLIFTPCF